MRNALSILALLVAGAGSLWAGTGGFQVLTAEGARRLEIEEQPRPLPAVLLQDQRGEAFQLQDLQGSNLLIEFIYTRCPTVCTALGETFEQIGRKLPADARVHMVSISFDPRDDVDDLKSYASRFAYVPEYWHIARVEDSADIDALLKTFGVTVIPDHWGGFEHNAAVHFVNREGYLDRIVDHYPPAIAMESLWKRL